MESYSGLARVADREGFVVAFPSATGPRRSWNLDPGRAPDDVGFVAALIERVATVACVDPGRIFVVGVSNGGASRRAWAANCRTASLDRRARCRRRRRRGRFSSACRGVQPGELGRRQHGGEHDEREARRMPDGDAGGRAERVARITIRPPRIATTFVPAVIRVTTPSGGPLCRPRWNAKNPPAVTATPVATATAVVAGPPPVSTLASATFVAP